MSLDLPAHADTPLTQVEQLVEELRKAEKPAAQHRLGLEHEKLIYPVRAAPTAVPYDGPSGIGALLERLSEAGATPFRESPGSPVIALQRGSETISLEPGGQLELSGAPATTAREVHAGNLAHLEGLRAATQALGLEVVALGYRPFGVPAQMPWMPKTRYAAMRETLGPRGTLAHHMMLMTATVQVSLDWASEADCARKMAVLARMTPELVALYANSPLVEDRPCGFLSFRSHIWTDVDAARCGFFSAMLDGSFTYRAYVEWALDAPLLFLRRGGKYLTPGAQFRSLLAQGFEGAPVTMTDWRDHLSTLFPEVRLKSVMEVRSADCVGPALSGALPALLRGLVYDKQALREAESMLPPRSLVTHQARMERARRLGLRDPEIVGTARALLALARAGLRRLDPEDVSLLEPLEAVAESGRSPAEAVLEVAASGASRAELLARFCI